MKATGIICEYNPIHNGHARQIEYAKAHGADVIVCIMSGNFTQRGEFAIADKYTRAKTAIVAGADLVLELPFPFSSMSAEFFANAGVYILSHLGVDTLSFGHECESIDVLKNAADVITSDAFIEKLDQKSAQGKARSFFDTLADMSGNPYSLGSNDILGAYYLAAIKKHCPSMNVLPIRREGSAYNDDSLHDGILPSANAIRKAVYESGSFADIPNIHIPIKALEMLISAENDSLAPVLSSSVSDEILSFFRLLTADDIKRRAELLSGGESILDDGHGIVERLISAAYDATSLDELLKLSYNTKFTNSRMNRVTLFSLFGVSDAMKYEVPEYTTLLASSRSGREFLSSIRKTAKIKIVTKPADAPKDSKQYKMSSLADIVYASAIPKNLHPNHFKYLSPYIEN